MSKGTWGRRGTAAATIAAELVFDKVSRHFDGFGAVIDFSLKIGPGQIVCLLGPSGCGKTTLLRIASGIERPTAGRVLINDVEVAGPQNFVPPEKRSVGYMFQDFALFPHLTVMENVGFGLKGLEPNEIRRLAGAALERVGLAHYADKYPDTLSGGEQQRVALARAVVPRPSVLLMDEPFSGLDAHLRGVMRKETLALLRETRATCLIVTHQPEEAMQLGDAIAVMRGGRLVQVGSAEELYREPVDIFVARMFSSVNEIPSVVEDGYVSTPFGRFVAAGFSKGQHVILCVRQRGIKILPSGKGVPARVVDAKFLGDAGYLEVAVDGFEGVLIARVPEQRCPRRGQDIGIAVDPKKVLIFDGKVRTE